MSCALAARVKLRSSTTKTKVRNKSVGILVILVPSPINTPTFLVDAKPLAHRRQTSPICRRCCASPDGNGCGRRSTGTRAGRGAANPFGVEVSGDRVSSAPILEIGAATVLIPWYLAAQSHTHRRQRFTPISDRLLHCCEMTLCAISDQSAVQQNLPLQSRRRRAPMSTIPKRTAVAMKAE
jgi:hypothetical protein